MSLKSMAMEKKPAFGSIIPVERSAMALAADQPVFGTCQLTQAHQFLVSPCPDFQVGCLSLRLS